MDPGDRPVSNEPDAPPPLDSAAPEPVQHETEVTEREAAPPVKPVAPPPRAVQARPMARPGAAVRRPAPALPASERTVRMPRATVLSAIPAQLAESMRRGELPEPATPSAVDDDYVVEVVAPRKG